jgi:predicted nucleic acid-binding protein
VIVYFDTSAFVPLLVAEPSSESCGRLWNEADDVVTTRLLYVESAAALAQALRMGRLTAREHRSTLRILDRLWPEFAVAELEKTVVDRAAELAHDHGLRAYDAVHCASAEQLDDGDLVVASGDQKLLQACASLGLAAANLGS